ncbi:MAG: RnfH family protein, partial [Gammaproteobacteria bacterium]
SWEHWWIPLSGAPGKSMDNPDQIQVEVVYALPDRNWSIPLTLAAGATLQQAIVSSGILAQCPEIDLAVNQVGIYGKLRALDTGLHTGDRVEIYRRLRIDPKEARRKRADGVQD